MSNWKLRCRPWWLLFCVPTFICAVPLCVPTDYANPPQGVTIKVMVNHSQQKQLVPGCFVDIHWWVITSKKKHEVEVRCLQQKMLVVVVCKVDNEKHQPGSETTYKLTVAATPDESRELTVAALTGTLKVKIRSDIPRLDIQKLPPSKHKTRRSKSLKTVLIAKHELLTGTILEDGASHFVRRTYVPGDDPKNCLHAFADVENTILRRALRKGDFVTSADIEDADAWVNRTRVRGVTIRVEQLQHKQADQLPGKRVNVLWTATPREQKEPRQLLLLKNVLVGVSSGETLLRSAIKEGSRATFVTLLLQPQAARVVAVAQTSGTFRIQTIKTAPENRGAKTRTKPKGSAHVTILVAKKPLPRATRLANPKQYFRKRKFSRDEAPGHAIASFEKVKNTYLARPLRAGDFVRVADLIAPLDKSGLQTPLVAIKLITPQPGIWSGPGYSTSRTAGYRSAILYLKYEGKEAVCKTLTENATVLEVEDSKSSPINWTLAVSSQEARNKILPAKKTRGLRVVLMREEDNDPQLAISWEQFNHALAIAHGRIKKRSSK